MTPLISSIWQPGTSVADSLCVAGRIWSAAGMRCCVIVALIWSGLSIRTSELRWPTASFSIWSIELEALSIYCRLFLVPLSFVVFSFVIMSALLSSVLVPVTELFSPLLSSHAVVPTSRSVSDAECTPSLLDSVSYYVSGSDPESPLSVCNCPLSPILSVLLPPVKL